MNTYDEVVRRVHEAMQAAPHDGKPYRQARAAISEVRQIVSEEIEAGKIAELLHGDTETEGGNCIHTGMYKLECPCQAHVALRAVENTNL